MMTNKLVAWGLVVVLGAFASNASAALVICQKGKKIKLRQDACTAKETQVPAAALGGTARALAQVEPGTASFVRNLNFTAVARPETGVYCLTPAPGLGLDPATTTVLTSVEWGSSSGDDLLVSAQNAVQEFDCPLGDYEIRTYKLPGGVATASDNVGFIVLIP